MRRATLLVGQTRRMWLRKLRRAAPQVYSNEFASEELSPSEYAAAPGIKEARDRTRARFFSLSRSPACARARARARTALSPERDARRRRRRPNARTQVFKIMKQQIAKREEGAAQRHTERREELTSSPLFAAKKPPKPTADDPHADLNFGF